VRGKCRRCKWPNGAFRCLVRTPFFINGIMHLLHSISLSSGVGFFTQGAVTQPTTGLTGAEALYRQTSYMYVAILGSGVHHSAPVRAATVRHASNRAGRRSAYSPWRRLNGFQRCHASIIEGYYFQKSPTVTGYRGRHRAFFPV